MSGFAKPNQTPAAQVSAGKGADAHVRRRSRATPIMEDLLPRRDVTGHVGRLLMCVVMVTLFPTSAGEVFVCMYVCIFRVDGGRLSQYLSLIVNLLMLCKTIVLWSNLLLIRCNLFSYIFVMKNTREWLAESGTV